MKNPGPSIRDLNWGQASSLQPSSLSSGAVPAACNQPVRMIRELLESNQALLAHIHHLEQILSTSESDAIDSGSIATGETEDSAQPPHCAIAQEMLTQAHQVVVHQTRLISSLAQHVEANLSHVADFERDIALNQKRHREQAHQLVQLEQDYQSLHRRLQRQQYYSLQLKAALEKTIRKSQVDPAWIQDAWETFAQEGSNALSPINIASWSEAHTESSPPVPDEMERLLSVVKDSDASDDNSPWTASQLLIGGDTNDFYDDFYNAGLDMQPETQEVTGNLSLFSQETVGWGEAPPNTPAPRQESECSSPPVEAEDLDPSSPMPEAEPQPPEAPPSCSFQLSEPKPGEKPSRKASLPDLPSFLKPKP